MIVFVFFAIVVVVAYFLAVCVAVKNVETYIEEDDDD